MLLWQKVGAVIFEASMDKETVPYLPQGNLETDAADSTILSKAARCPHQLLLAVKITCDPPPNVLSSQHFQNGQVFIPDKSTKFCMGLLPVNPSEFIEKNTDWHSPLLKTFSVMSQKVMWNLQNN